METKKTIKNKKIITTLLVIALIATIAFWLSSYSFNVYTYKVTGAIFEMLSVPMLLLTIALPIVAIVYFFKDGRSIKSPFLYIAILSTAFAVLFFY